MGRERICRWGTSIGGSVAVVAAAAEEAVVEVAVGGLGKEYVDDTAVVAPVVGLVDVGDV